MTDHQFIFRVDSVSFQFNLMAPHRFAKLSKRKRAEILRGLRDKLGLMAFHIPKDQRNHFYRWGGQLLEFAAGETLAKVEDGLGFESVSIDL